MKKKSVWYYLTLAAIALVIFSVTVLRHDETSTTDAPLTNAASAIFLAAMTLGPGMLAKEVFFRLLPAEELSRQRRRLLRDTRADKKKCERAQWLINNRSLWCRWWDEQKAMLVAAYTLAFREGGGVVPKEEPPQQEPPKDLSAGAASQREAPPKLSLVPKVQRSSREVERELAALNELAKGSRPTVPNPYRSDS